MSKTKKIVEAVAVLEQKLGRLDRALSKLLTPAQMKEIEPELGHVKTVHRLLKAKVAVLDPGLKSRLDSALSIGKDSK